MKSFAETADRIAATSRTLEKRRRLAEYLRSLPESDLYWAVTYFSGLTFPRASGRVVQLGFAAIRSAAAAALELPDPGAFDPGYALRFPRILRVSGDKGVDDINTVADVRRLYERYYAAYQAAGTES